MGDVIGDGSIYNRCVVVVVIINGQYCERILNHVVGTLK